MVIIGINTSHLQVSSITENKASLDYLRIREDPKPEKKWTRDCSCVPKGRGHILQQNRAVLFVWLLYSLILQYQILFIKCAFWLGPGANLEVPSFLFVWLL